MKRLLLSPLLVFFTCFILTAQQEFPIEWKSTFPVSTKWHLINEDRTLALGGDLNELAMIDAKTGKVLWTVTFIEKFRQKTAKDWKWENDKGVISVTFNEENKGTEMTYYLDEKTAEIVSKESYDQIKVKPSYRAGKGTLVIGEVGHQTIVSLDYEKEKSSSFNRGNKERITVNAHGENNWSTTIHGEYVRTLCANAVPSSATDFDRNFLKLIYENRKVLVIYEGISVLDAKTGNLLWQADIDNTDSDLGVSKSTQTLGRCSYPIVSRDAVYVTYLVEGELHHIKKYDLETGRLIWESEKLNEGDVIPDIQISGNILLAQFGGRLETQTYLPGTNDRPGDCKSEMKLVGNRGVKAYSTSTGEVLWQTDKMIALDDPFGNAITNIITQNNIAFVAGDKNLYAFDVSTGNPRFTVPVSKLKIGTPWHIIKQNDQNLLIQAEEGIASISMIDGKVNYTTNTGKCLSLFYEGNGFFVWNGKSTDDFSSFVRIDPNNGKILGEIEDTHSPFFTPDGDAFVKFSGEKVIRYKTGH